LITLVLPVPPSANDLFDGGKRTKRRFKSDRYKAWEDEADGCLYQQKRGVVVGKYIVEIALPEMMRGDVDNRIKAIVDYLGPKGRGLTPDDKHLWKVSVERDPTVEPGWCHVRARAV
jgi:Holliday junction resolvase RusA-like endonuclease